MRFKKLSNKNVLEIREICQPPSTSGHLPMRLGRRLSIYLTIFFLHLNVNPLAITYSRFIIGLIGIGMIGFGVKSLVISGLIIYHFAAFLDWNDGEVFRYRSWKSGRKESIIVGSYLDKVFDAIFRPLLLIAAGIGAWNVLGAPIYLVLGGLGAFLISADQLIKLRIFEILTYKNELSYLGQEKDAIGQQSGKLDWIYELFRINNPLTLYFWFGIFGYLWLFLWIIIPLLALILVKTYFSQLNRVLTLDKQIVRKHYRR